jgi:hypothetical protein
MPQDNQIPFADVSTMTDEDMAVRASEDQVISSLDGSVDNPLAQITEMKALQESSLPIGMSSTEELQRPIDVVEDYSDPVNNEDNAYAVGSALDSVGQWIVKAEADGRTNTPDFKVMVNEWERLNEQAEGIQEVFDARDAIDRPEQFDEIFNAAAEVSPQDSGGLKDFGRSVGGGVLKAGVGLGQMALSGAEAVGIPGAGELNEDYTSFYDRAFEEIDRRGSDNPLTSSIGDVAGMIAPLVLSPISGGRTMLPTMSTNLANIGAMKTGQLFKQTADLAALEGILFKGAEEDSSRAEDAYAGGKLGLATTVVLNRVGAAGGLVGRSEAGKMITKEIGDLSTKFKVPTTLGEARNSRGIQVVESILDQVPVIGMSGFRNQQLVALRDAADNMVRSIGGVVDDVGTTLQASLKKVLDKNKAASAKEYNAIGKVMGSRIVPMTETEAVSQAVLKQLKSNKDLLGKNPAEAGAQRVADATTKKPVMSIIVDRLGREIQKGIDSGAQKTWSQLRDYRSDLGKKITQAQNAVKNGTGSFGEVQALTQIKKAVEKDLETAALAAGDDVFKMWKKADANYKSKVIPFQKGALKRSLTEGIDTDTILASFVKQDKAFGTGTARAQQLFANTEKGGQQAVKYSVLQDAWTNASKGGEFNAQQFIGQLQKTSAARKVIFDKAEQDSLNGFIKLVNSIPRAQAGQTIGMNAQARRILSGGGVNRGGTSATGFGTAAAGAAGLGSLTSSAAIPIVGGVKGVSILLTTQKGRDILARYPKSMPNDRQKFISEANSVIMNTTRQLIQKASLED